MTVLEGCSRDTRSLIDRLWSRLGFGHAHVERPADVEGFCGGYCMADVFSHLDWRDRLRVLVSGKVMVQTAMQTDVGVRKMRSVSTLKVLPPNYPMRAP